MADTHDTMQRDRESSFADHHTQVLTPVPPSAGLVVGLRRTATGEEYGLDDSVRRRWVVGANENCDVALGDSYVSGRHCVLERRPGGAVIVRDCSSRNGTYIDGNRVEVAELRAGSHLVVGRTTLIALAAFSREARCAVELIRGCDPTLRTALDHARRAAQTECSILILGETGTGKDLLARLIHEHSRRRGGPFVPVNCGAIPRELVATELFGHEKGSFTGAGDSRDGYFVQADRGTLFLDEIGELPIELQPHLLRVLETRSVRRVGGQSERSVDVRIVAATNQLDGIGTETARLRTDVYHRLATVVLSLPPLRERMSDLGELVDAMLLEFAPEHGHKHVTPEGWDALAGYHWPGNVRELRGAVARAVALGGDELGPLDFFPNLGQAYGSIGTPMLAALAHGASPYRVALRSAMEQALLKHGTVRAAAASIGMPKSTFADKAKAWNLPIRRKVRIRIPSRD
jgi:DNA-binding NtrC family response regulator